MSDELYDLYNTGEFDTLASDSSVRLFGRIMWDIVLREPDARKIAYPLDGDNTYPDPLETDPVPRRHSSNNFLIEQLRREDANFARISSFTYQNEMFDLVKPAIFLVHGNGTRVEFLKGISVKERSLRKSPSFTERTGMVGQKGSFAPDIFMWTYDRADFTIRLDTETGSFDQVLLARELGGPIGTDFMESAGTDPPPLPGSMRRRRRRWRNSEE